MKIRQTSARFTRMVASGYKRFVTLVMLAGLAGGLMPGSVQADCLTGWNTVDHVLLSPALVQGTVVHYTVTTSGNGSNQLTVKVQQQKVGGGWDTLDKIKIDVGDIGSGTFTVQNYFASTDENVRFRMSRDLGTDEICYDISLSF